MSTKDAEDYRISPRLDHLVVEGGTEQAVALCSQKLFLELESLPSQRCVDFLLIAAGVYGVDRTVRKKRRQRNPNGLRTLRLTFEVEDYSFWASPDITNQVEEALHFLTDENWSIRFERAVRRPGIIGYQSPFRFPRSPAPTRAALYSGGLDSAAGLANQLLKTEDRYLLVTVEHQRGLRSRAKEQISGLGAVIDTHAPLHVSLITNLRGGRAHRIDIQETSQRSRAFLFCATAAVAAREFGISSIEVFENGVGTINFPLTNEMLGSGLATRGAHPTFLRQMAELASRVTERRLTFELPFGFHTKGEMLGALTGRGLDTWLQQTRSCIHTSLREKGVHHCGRCPACIERRQAFLVSGVAEQAADYRVDISACASGDGEDARYFQAFRDEADAWLAADPDTLRRMADHLRITGIPGPAANRIHDLQTRHAAEVCRVFSRRGYAYNTKDISPKQLQKQQLNVEETAS